MIRSRVSKCLRSYDQNGSNRQFVKCVSKAIRKRREVDLVTATILLTGEEPIIVPMGTVTDLKNAEFLTLTDPNTGQTAEIYATITSTGALTFRAKRGDNFQSTFTSQGYQPTKIVPGEKVMLQLQEDGNLCSTHISSDGGEKLKRCAFTQSFDPARLALISTGPFDWMYPLKNIDLQLLNSRDQEVWSLRKQRMCTGCVGTCNPNVGVNSTGCGCPFAPGRSSTIPKCVNIYGTPVADPLVSF